MNGIPGQQLFNHSVEYCSSLMAVVFKQVDNLPAVTFYIMQN